MHLSLGRSLRLVVAAWTMIAVGVGVPSPVHALDPADVELDFVAVGTRDGFWEVRLKPGQEMALAARMSNVNEKPIEVITYRGNVMTASGGGLQVSEVGEAAQGSTLWVDYGRVRKVLEGGSGETREFRVSVPQGVAPGDYTAAVVLQNAKPAIPPGQEGGIQLGQIFRKILTVKVRVPGPYRPELGIGEPGLAERPVSSVVTVGITNPGNQNLYPQYEAELRDESGAVLATIAGNMDKFYAGTNSVIEIPVDGFLAPGRYSVDLTLTDDEIPVPVTKFNMPLQVGDPPASAGENPEIVNPGISAILVAAIGLILLSIVAFMVWLLVRRNRSRHRRVAPKRPSMPAHTVGSGVPRQVGSTSTWPRRLTLAQLIPVIGARLRGLNGDTGTVLNGMSDLYPGTTGRISLATLPQDIPAIRETNCSAVLVTPQILSDLMSDPRGELPALVAVDDPAAVAADLTEAAKV